MTDAWLQLLFAVSSVSSPDVIGDLPTEIVAKIFRNLNGASLVSASRVNHRWMSVCKGDPVLRSRIHRQIKKEKTIQKQNISLLTAELRMVRTNQVKPLGDRNGVVRVAPRSVKLDIPNSSPPILKKIFYAKVHPSTEITILTKNENEVRKSIVSNRLKKRLRL